MHRILVEWNEDAALQAGVESACVGKINYKREASAEKAADALNAKGDRRHFLEAYPCPFCEGWHLGRMMEKPWKVEYAVADDYVDPQGVVHIHPAGPPFPMRREAEDVCERWKDRPGHTNLRVVHRVVSTWEELDA